MYWTNFSYNCAVCSQNVFNKQIIVQIKCVCMIVIYVVVEKHVLYLWCVPLYTGSTMILPSIKQCLSSLARKHSFISGSICPLLDVFRRKNVLCVMMGVANMKLAFWSRWVRSRAMFSYWKCIERFNTG